MRLLCLAIIGMLLTTTAALAQEAKPLTLYVWASMGNDSWSGRLPDRNQAKTDGPFATIARARDELRKLNKLGQLPNGATVVIGDGLYFLSETLTFGPEDSGSPNAPIVYKAGPSCRPVITGGRFLHDANLTETTVAGQRAWQVKLPEVASGQWNFRQLFVNRKGQDYWTRRFRPMKGMLVVAGLTYSPARKSQAHRAAQQDFIYAPGDLEQFENLSDVEVVAIHSWSASRLKIKSLDTKENVVTFTSVPTFKIGAWYRDERNPYYVENVKEELKQPGQWYLDRPTGLFTYLPLPDETKNHTAMCAPVLDKLMVVKGDAEKGGFVQNLSFEGLTFACTDWAVPDAGYDVSQGQPTLPAAIEISGAQRTGLRNCVVTGTGAYGVGLGLGTNECFVTGCYLYDLGGGGVKVGDSAMKNTAEFPLLPTGNIIENNTIRNYGVQHFSANGIWCGIANGTKIRHNEVAYGPYTGIAVGWCWGITKTSCGNNLIEANHVHDVMDLVQDGGGIYTLGWQPGTIIRGNLIHGNHKSAFACAEGQCGLYFDEGSSEFLVEDNVQYDLDYEKGAKIAQNRNEGVPHVIRNNFLAIAPDDPTFPKQIAAKAGVEKALPSIVYPVKLVRNPVYDMKMPVLPPVPVDLSLTFEDIPVGNMARRFSLAGVGGKAGFAVTEETAKDGTRSLKITDAADLGKSFYPYATYNTGDLEKGQVTISFDIKQKADQPGKFGIDVRDYVNRGTSEFASAVSFEIMEDGKLLVKGKEVAALPVGEWSRIEMSFGLGNEAPKEYALTVTLPGQEAQTVKLPYASPNFSALSSLYMIADDDKDAVTYLDNLTVTAK